MKVATVGIIGLLILTGGLSAQKAPSISARNVETFTGQITDSLCANNGSHIGLVKSEKNCVLTCVKYEGAQFVLYNSSSKNIYKLDDQRQPEAFAGREVTVTGIYDKQEKAIHVIDIRPKITYAGLRGNTSSGRPQL